MDRLAEMIQQRAELDKRIEQEQERLRAERVDGMLGLEVAVRDLAATTGRTCTSRQRKNELILTLDERVAVHIAIPRDPGEGSWLQVRTAGQEHLLVDFTGTVPPVSAFLGLIRGLLDPSRDQAYVTAKGTLAGPPAHCMGSQPHGPHTFNTGAHCDGIAECGSVESHGEHPYANNYGSGTCAGLE